jgi:NMD protein affecting ribosome stability and mRNA decay
MKERNKLSAPRGSGRRRCGRAQQDQIDDPYRSTSKPAEPLCCLQCGAVYQDGRWNWSKRPATAHEVVCQACHRINDNYPAGVMTMRGLRSAGLKSEIRRLALHQEAAEHREHPLNRIMNIEDEADGLVISTTDIHLPRRIAEAVQRAYKGELEMHFDHDAYSVRIDWTMPG